MRRIFLFFTFFSLFLLTQPVMAQQTLPSWAPNPETPWKYENEMDNLPEVTLPEITVPDVNVEEIKTRLTAAWHYLNDLFDDLVPEE